MELTGTREDVHRALHNALQSLPPKRDRGVRAALDVALFVINSKSGDWVVVSTDSYLMTVTVVGEADHWLKVASSGPQPAGRQTFGLHAIDVEKLVKMLKPKRAERDQPVKVIVEADWIGVESWAKGDEGYKGVAPSFDRAQLGDVDNFPMWRSLFTRSYHKEGSAEGFMLSPRMLGRLAKMDGGTALTPAQDEIDAPVVFRQTGVRDPISFRIGRTEGLAMPMAMKDMDSILDYVDRGKELSR